MISNINITDFRERLNKNTKLGNPKIKGTPFAVISKSGEPPVTEPNPLVSFADVGSCTNFICIFPVLASLEFSKMQGRI